MPLSLIAKSPVLVRSMKIFASPPFVKVSTSLSLCVKVVFSVRLPPSFTAPRFSFRPFENVYVVSLQDIHLNLVLP